MPSPGVRGEVGWDDHRRRPSLAAPDLSAVGRRSARWRVMRVNQPGARGGGVVDYVALLKFRSAVSGADRDAALTRRAGWQYPEGLQLIAEYWPVAAPCRYCSQHIVGRQLR